MLYFRRFTILLVVFLLIPPSVVQADIVFTRTQISPLTWPWPVAVAPEDGIFLFQGVVWADHNSVNYSFTEGFQVYEETVMDVSNAGPISAYCDDTGAIHVCCRAQLGDYGLFYATKPAFGTWESERVATGADLGQSCAVGLLNGYGPVIAYVDETEFLEVLRFAYPGPFEWTDMVLDEGVPGDQHLLAVTMATDGQDAVHIAWSNFSEVRYCSSPYAEYEVVTTESGITSLSVAIGEDDQPRLAILADGKLYYAVRSAKGWAVEPVLPGQQSVQEMSMAYGYEDVPHIAFVTDDPDDPVMLATEFLGDWREQPLTDMPTYGLIQRPSITASSQSYPSLHLVAAWVGAGLQISADMTNLPAFAVTRLRAAPLGELESTVELYSTTQYPMANHPVLIDFTVPGVMDTVNFCYTYRDTLKRWTDDNGMLTFNMETGGAVTGGIRILRWDSNPEYRYVVEGSLPMAGVDLEGNGSVTVTDREWFLALMGTNDPRGDLDFSGLVDEADLQILLDHLGNNCTISGVDDGEITPLNGPRLSVHPNPTSGTTTVSWRLPVAANVRVTVFDLAGRRVRDLVTDSVQSGERSVKWDGRDFNGRHVSAGVYLVRMQAGSAVIIKRLVRVR